MKACSLPPVSAAPGNAFDYRLYGWRLRSTRPLLFLVPAELPQDLADITVHFAPVPLPDEVQGRQLPFIQVLEDARVFIASPNGIRIAVEAGQAIVVDADPGVTEAELFSLICGPATAALCHQRGAPPLHAAVLSVKGQGIAVAGDSGAGKSTTARALLARGARLVTDDQAIVDPRRGMVQPGYPSMKLWDNSAAVFGEELNPAMRVRQGWGKFHVSLADVFEPEPVPLRGVFVLQPDTTAMTLARVERIRQAEGVATLFRMILRREMAIAIDGGRAAFRHAAWLAERVPVWIVHRADALDRIDRLAELILETAAQTEPRDP